MGKQNNPPIKTATTKPLAKKAAAEGNTLLFAKGNYTLMLIGIAIIFTGFVLMSGGATDNPNVFNYDLFSFRRIILAPVVVIAGFIVEIFAIMKKHPEENS